MDHPAKQVASVILQLTEGTPKEQQHALETYFVPDASFNHPLCTAPSFKNYKLPVLGLELNSRWVIWMIYRWYKIISPVIRLTVKSRDYDQKSQILFVEMTQHFSLFFVPWDSPLNLTTKLHLIQDEETGKYYVTHQEDLYQSNELIKIFAPHQITDLLVFSFQLWATFLCIVGALTLAPVTWMQQSIRAKKE